MGIAERSPSSCAETHGYRCVKRSQEQVLTTSWVAVSPRTALPAHSMVVSTQPTLPPAFFRDVVVPPSSRLVDECNFKTFSPSESSSASYHHAVLVKEAPLTLADDYTWIASTMEQPQTMSLGDDLPNEAAVTRKTLLSQIRHKTRGRYIGLPNVATLKMGFPVVPGTRLATFPLKGTVNLRQCPGGKTGNGGGGAGGGAGGGGNWASSSLSAIGNDPHSSLVTGRRGDSGDDDDNPFNNGRPVDLPREHYAEFSAFEFDPLRDIPNLQLPSVLDDLLLPEFGLPSMESIHSSQFNETRSAPVYREDISDPAPMTPVPPMTPGTPMPSGYQAPLTPSNSTYLTDPMQDMSLNPAQHHRSTMTLPLDYGHSSPGVMPASDPVHGSLVSPHQAQTQEKAELQNLLDITRLMRKNSSGSGHPRPPSARRSSGSRRAPYTAPQVLRSSHFSHHSPRVSQPAAAASNPVRRVQSPQATHDPVQFFKDTFVVQGNRLVIGVQVNSAINQSNQQIAHQALLHCYQLCMRYKECLDKECDLAVAMQNKAKLCEFNFDFVKMKLSFYMPSDCLRLDKWMERNSDQDICARQLILQQVLNTFVSLFQGPNQICFWGSFEVWIANNMKVYLFIDFNKALQVQKQYSTLSIEQNPRLEDCTALSGLYRRVLRPYLNCDLTWLKGKQRQ